MKTREEQHRELTNKLEKKFGGYFYAGEIADFILNDRRRICGPLIKYRKELVSDKIWGNRSFPIPFNSIDKVLDNAGLLGEA